VKRGPARELLARAEVLGVGLDVDQAGALVALFDRLLLEPQNLTAIDNVADAVDRHLADSLAGLTRPELSGPTLADLGSGRGFPGLVIAMLRPEIAVTLVESERRKCEWLSRASANLPNVRVVADRSEALAKLHREAFATVTARAVAPLVATIELAAPLTAVDGHLVAWLADAALDDPGATEAAEMVGFDAPIIHAVEPFPGARRYIATLRKRAPTPARYPRRAGRAATRPLVTSPSDAAGR
jgi:16S rRNA (guanine527-N7)-methyltransferase